LIQSADSAPSSNNAAHRLHKVLGLRDLIPMQILLVFGAAWTGTAAHQAGTQVSFWLIGAALLIVRLQQSCSTAYRSGRTEEVPINGPNMRSARSPDF
jgi:hypothetical protein